MYRQFEVASRWRHNKDGDTLVLGSVHSFAPIERRTGERGIAMHETTYKQNGVGGWCVRDELEESVRTDYISIAPH